MVGLGNPGNMYEKTRHNTGFIAMDYIANKLGLSFKAGKGEYFFSSFEFSKTKKVFFLKPTTFMNASGIAVYDFASQMNINPEQILVILDDFSLEFGLIRIRKMGSDGGHKGLGSIIFAFNTEKIPRLRIGIGPLPENTDPVDYVLSPFSPGELAQLGDILKLVYNAFTEIITNGIENAMNKFNRTKKGVKNE